MKTVELLPSPFFFDGSMSYRFITGARISIYNPEKENPQYIGPQHEEYAKKFVNKLYNKYSAALLDREKVEIVAANAQLKLLSGYKTQKVNVPKDIKVIEMIGYKFDFELSVPAVIQRVLYYGGAGEACSMGMGWVEIIENGEI